MRLLLTRPEPDAQRTASALRAQGHEVLVAPLLRIEAASDARIGAGPWAAILVTSANAAHAIAQHERVPHLRGVPALAVGERSAQAMREAAFADIASADGNVGDLARLAVARIKPGSNVLYLAGEDRSGDLAGELSSRGIAVETAIVYRAVAVTGLPRAAADALTSDIDGVLHFSPRSARIYVELARGAGLLGQALKPAQFCLSDQVAKPLAEAGAATIRIAPKPTEAALIGLMGPAPS